MPNPLQTPNPLPSQPNFPALEAEVLQRWKDTDTFARTLVQTADGEPFIIYDGPPYANALPPLHTAVPMSFKDVMGRYQTMRGRYVPRQNGWDTHGLPIEVQVEKKLGLASKKDILNLVPGDITASIAKFNEICKESVFTFKQSWDEFVPRVGYWTDISNPYVTYEPEYIYRSWAAFRQVWDRGHVSKGFKILPYCTRCGTGLSAAEVAQEYRDVHDVSAFVSFPLVDNPKRSFLAWTTTPWTLPGNTALAVGAAIEYVVVQQEAREYILAKEKLNVLEGDFVILEEVAGASLVGMRYQPPFADVYADQPGERHLVLAADFVTTSEGTGIVHIAPMYGEDDFKLGKEAGLVQVHTVATDGTFLPNTGALSGIPIRDALGQLLTALTNAGALYKKLRIEHSYPHCWRCKTPLVYYANDSWYITMSTLRDELVANNKTVDWIPDHLKDGRFGDFIEQARDWAISRERFWGIPLPVWVSESGKEICIGSLEELRTLATDPSLLGEGFDPHRPFIDGITLSVDGEVYTREPYVLDIWFDSGAMPFASERKAKDQFPADYIAEAIDQTRGWFYSMMALSTAMGEGSPYRRVVCMGHLVDETGKKMSKSVGNTIDPWELFSTHGADTFRWFIYSVNAPGESKAISDKELQGAARRSLMLVWNMVNYLASYRDQAEGMDDASQEKTGLLLDAWVRSRQADTLEQLTAHLELADFQRGTRLLENYIADLSTWYLRRSRKRRDGGFFATFSEVLRNLLVMMAPFVPFITDGLWDQVRRSEDPDSVHLVSWPAPALEDRDDTVEAAMELVRALVEQGLALRAELGLKVRQPLARARLTLTEGLSADAAAILADELNVLVVEQGALEPGLPAKTEAERTVALDPELTDALRQAGLARDLQRQMQAIRKQRNLQPGQIVVLLVDPSFKDVIEPLVTEFPAILQETFIGEVRYQSASTEITLDNHPVLIDLQD